MQTHLNCIKKLILSFLLAYLVSNLNTVEASIHYDLSTPPEHFNYVFYDSANSNLGWMRTADFNGDGAPDLILSSSGSDKNGSNTGSTYIIFDINSYLSSVSTTEIDLSVSTNYHLRIDGAGTDSYHSRPTMADINNDGNDELLISGATSFNSRTSSGSVYIYNGVLLSTYASSTGNVIQTSDTTQFWVRYDGPEEYSFLGLSYGHTNFTDIDNDGGDDILIKVETGQNGVDYSGSAYLIKSSLISAISGTGNTRDLASATSYNVRIDGDGEYNIMYGGTQFIDLDRNGEEDLVIMNGYATYEGRSSSGGGWIIRDTAINSLSGTGNILDMRTPANYWIRIYGSASNEILANTPSNSVTDLNGDGYNDLILGAAYADKNSRTNSGSLYIIDNAILNAISSDGSNLDLNNSSSYSLRIDGAEASSTLSNYYFSLSDLNSDSLPDLLIAAEGTFGVNPDGYIYMIDNSLINDFSSTGTIVDLATPQNYTYRFIGQQDGALVGPYAQDINNDGIRDMLLSSDLATIDGRTQSGAGYIIFNFPQSISFESGSFTDEETYQATVTVDASDASLTNVAGVEVQLNSNSFTGTWQNCSASDGTFDETTETVVCTISSVPAGANTLYFRAVDEKGTYTASSQYLSVPVEFIPASPTPTLTPSATPTIQTTPGVTTTQTNIKNQQQGRAANCPEHFSYCSHFGPNAKQTETGFVTGTGETGKLQVYLPKAATPHDVHIEFKKVNMLDMFSNPKDIVPFPWMQGYNTAGEIYKINVLSAFNGYPIVDFEAPGVVIVPFDANVLASRNIDVNRLRIAFFNTQTRKWQIIPNDTVVNWQDHTLANITQNYGYFAVVYGRN